MKINEVSKLTGLTAKTIRFYESRGLISPASDEHGGKRWRDYSETDVKQLEIVSELRRALFPVKDIKAMLDDPRQLPDILSSHRAALDEMYESLGTLRTALCSSEAENASNAAMLADALSSATVELPLPAIDLKPRFKHIDELEEILVPAKRKPVYARVFDRKFLVVAVAIVIIAAAVAYFPWLLNPVKYNGENYRAVNTYTTDPNYLTSRKSFTGGGHPFELHEDTFSYELKILFEGDVIPRYTFNETRNYNDGTSVAQVKKNGVTLETVRFQYNEDFHFTNPEAVTISTFILKAQSMSSLKDRFTTAGIVGAIVFLLFIGARVMVPIINGTASSDKNERLLGYAAMQGIGTAVAGGRNNTIEQVRSSPMGAGYVITDQDKRNE